VAITPRDTDNHPVSPIVTDYTYLMSATFYSFLEGEKVFKKGFILITCKSIR